MTPKQIAKKEPFKRIMPFTTNTGWVSGNEMQPVSLPSNMWESIPQEKFLSELHPSGHNINLRQSKIVRDKDGNVVSIKEVAKIAVAIQQMIATKQKIHIVTNPVQFTLTEDEITDAHEKTFTNLKQAWEDKNMHVAISEMVGSRIETGDGAWYVYRNNGVLGWKTFSFKKGDVLLPHYDNFGNLEVFGRLYRGVDKDNKEITKMDVFDKKEVVTFIKKGILGTSRMETWKEVKGSRKKHGFTDIPICYTRKNDVAWGDVQPLIEALEDAISNMSENNKYYANMILFLKGSIKDMPDRDDAGKVLIGKDDADAKFLASPESSASQITEIEMLLKQIFMGSFTVSISPDTIKAGGDLPGITVKLMFSPATEKALDTIMELDPVIDKMIKLFKEGYGIEIKKPLEFEKLKVRGALKVYVPENTEETVRMLNDSVFAKTISRQTANEKNPMAVNGEKDRVNEELLTENAGSMDVVE